MIHFQKFQQSLEHLQAQFENYQQLDDALPILMREGIKESVIQRFETCYDCMWKVLKRHLSETLGIPEVSASPKGVFRIANENKLLPSKVEQWIAYADARIGTSHDYSGSKADTAISMMPEFIQDAIQLFETLSGTPWQKT